MRLLSATALLIAAGWAHHLCWALGASPQVMITAQQPNCSWISVASSAISFELNDTFMTSAELAGGVCSVSLEPELDFKQKAENYVFRLNNRHLLCQLSVQIEDQLYNKTLALCTWPEDILQTSTAIRVFASGEPATEPAEFHLHKDIVTTGLLLTGVAFYRPHNCDEFKCRSSRICIPKLVTCDGVRHCPDGSDESTANEDNVCSQYNSDSFSRIGIVLTSALLISVGLVFAAVIRRTLLERLKKPSKYEVNPGKELQYTENETSFMSPELDTF